jgi:type III secretory pathway component EscR
MKGTVMTMPIATRMVSMDDRRTMAIIMVVSLAAFIVSVIVDTYYNHKTVNVGHCNHAKHIMDIRPNMAIRMMLMITMTMGMAIPTSAAVIHYENSIITQNQITATIQAFTAYYGIESFTTQQGDNVHASLLKSFQGSAHETVRITYVDSEGRFRDGSIVITSGKMTLYASDSYVSTRLPTTSTLRTNTIDSI